MVVIVHNKKLVVTVLLVAIISIAMGGFFISQGIGKSNLIVEAMRLEQVTYGGADGEIEGIIDTPQEAQIMANILREHRLESYGHYSELERDDPNRETILKALTMENSLNLAQLGYGLCDVVKATGAFMIVIGLTLGVTVVSMISQGRRTSHTS